jgi:hypothetical protein
LPVFSVCNVQVDLPLRDLNVVFCRGVIMLMAIVLLKALLEVAGMAMMGQAVLYLLAGAGREQNFFYRLLKLIGSPAVCATRFITPRRLVPDAHISMAAFFLVTGLWLALSLVKVELCRANPQHPVCAGLRVLQAR